MQRKTGVTLNRVKTNYGNCGDLLFKWSRTEASASDCVAAQQTVKNTFHLTAKFDANEDYKMTF